MKITNPTPDNNTHSDANKFWWLPPASATARASRTQAAMSLNAAAAMAVSPTEVVNNLSSASIRASTGNAVMDRETPMNKKHWMWRRTYEYLCDDFRLSKRFEEKCEQSTDKDNHCSLKYQQWKCIVKRWVSRAMRRRQFYSTNGFVSGNRATDSVQIQIHSRNGEEVGYHAVGKLSKILLLESETAVTPKKTAP
ncbi:hypothetical protein LXL04_032749 [Taraxacum kok-saghyz]